MKENVERLWKEQEHTLIVDYAQDLDHAINKGGYDWKNHNINPDNFKGSTEENDPKRYIEPGKRTSKVQTTIALFHFKRILSTQQVLSILDKLGYRPANLYELLALGANKKTRDLQGQFSIVALGSLWRDPSGLLRAPFLFRDGSGRHLYLGWTDDGWHAGARFAAVRK